MTPPNMAFASTAVPEQATGTRPLLTRTAHCSARFAEALDMAEMVAVPVDAQPELLTGDSADSSVSEMVASPAGWEQPATHCPAPPIGNDACNAKTAEPDAVRLWAQSTADEISAVMATGPADGAVPRMVNSFSPERSAAQSMREANPQEAAVINTPGPSKGSGQKAKVVAGETAAGPLGAPRTAEPNPNDILPASFASALQRQIEAPLSRAMETAGHPLDLYARDWVGRLSQDIAVAHQSGSELSFRLAPRNLGQLDIGLGQTADGLVIELRPTNSDAAAIIAREEPRLIEELRQRGVSVSESNLHFGANGDGRSSRNGAIPRPHLPFQLSGRIAVEDQDQQRIRPAGRFA